MCAGAAACCYHDGGVWDRAVHHPVSESVSQREAGLPAGHVSSQPPQFVSLLFHSQYFSVSRPDESLYSVVLFVMVLRQTVPDVLVRLLRTAGKKLPVRKLLLDPKIVQFPKFWT